MAICHTGCRLYLLPRPGLNQPLKGHMIKPGIKHCLQWFCASFGPHRRSRSTPRLLVLMYHRILDEQDERTRFEEPGMIVTPDSFRMHMEQIRKYFSPVQLCDWVDYCPGGSKRPGMFCAVTFDDGWADNYENAYPILKELDIPATIFLATDLIGTSNMFWPEKLSRLLLALPECASVNGSHPATAWLRDLLPGNHDYWNSRPGPENLAAAIDRAKSLPDNEINRLLSETIDSLDLEIGSDRPSLLDWEQVTEMIESGLVDIASHTRRHIRLGSETPRAVLESEIIGSKNVIREKTGHSARAFCFPNGDYSPQALELVRQHYQCAVSTSSGWNSCKNDIHLLRRIGIHNDATSNSTAFLARISGWM